MKKNNDWPALKFEDIQDTMETLHQWIQIVGKVRLRTMPWQNHSWHTTLYITPAGFSTYSIPYKGGAFQIDFDFKDHKLHISSSDTESLHMELRTGTVAAFYSELLEKLASMRIEVP